MNKKNNFNTKYRIGYDTLFGGNKKALAFWSNKENKLIYITTNIFKVKFGLFIVKLFNLKINIDR